ncbi:putative Twin-arginine translocation pathway signal protein [Streptomyces viridochromogenes Tue57]|uniref:Putative Twin-arginine translocation pathway signal protein n=1 Tax=Streptomyces viridochromogenes Tue57 TaxID=1160705 RepID=L8PEH8_STRVR|nr:putative Twin-arginine translocation pathway signal protein [Streptomyces viridochromogenes Tue57]
METGVTTPEPAGQGGPAPRVRVTVRSDDRQRNAHGVSFSLLPLECSVGDGRGTFVREWGDRMNYR